MATKSDNKALELVLNRFQELSANTKELDTTVSSFAQIADDFKTTLELLEETHSFKELEKHSKEALSRLKEMKSLNEHQVLDKLKELLQKELSGYNQKLETQLKKLVAQTQELPKGAKQADHEMLSLLRQIDSKLDRSQAPAAAVSSGSNEELNKLKRLVASMSSRLKKLEDDYEERISVLELEVEMLRGLLEDQPRRLPSAPVEITDDDLPF